MCIGFPGQSGHASQTGYENHAHQASLAAGHARHDSQIVHDVVQQEFYNLLRLLKLLNSDHEVRAYHT